MSSKLGVYSFGVGILLAAILAVFTGADKAPGWAVILLAVLGLVSGALNITGKEVQLFLIAVIAFMMSFTSLGAMVESLFVGMTMVTSFFTLLVTFIAPAAAIVAVKALYELTKD